MAENKYNLDELQKKIPYKTVSPILSAWDDMSDNDVTDLARMAYEAGRNSISKEKNKMAEVAAMFGKELNQEFTVRIKYKGKMLCKFCSSGLYYHEKLTYCWLPTSGEMLIDLLTGQAVIVDD